MSQDLGEKAIMLHHVKTALEFYDLYMYFVVWTLLPVHLTMASNGYVDRYLSKNICFSIF